jgi:hypothetical protein
MVGKDGGGGWWRRMVEEGRGEEEGGGGWSRRRVEEDGGGGWSKRRVKEEVERMDQSHESISLPSRVYCEKLSRSSEGTGYLWLYRRGKRVPNPSQA